MPTDKRMTPVPDGDREHCVLVVGGVNSYGVECSAHDFFAATSFATAEEAREDPAVLAHVREDTKEGARHQLAVRMAPEKPHFSLGCACGWSSEERFRRRFDAQMDPAGAVHLEQGARRVSGVTIDTATHTATGGLGVTRQEPT